MVVVVVVEIVVDILNGDVGFEELNSVVGIFLGCGWLK